MLSYCTHIKVNEEFNRDILIDLYLDWLETSRNKMEGLVYNGSDSFIYELEQKCLKIEDFKEQATLGLQFTTNENSRRMTFIVEVMYHYENQTLDLNFYQELVEESTYRGIQGIPNIFKRLLESSYIEKDHELEISTKPHFLSGKEYHEILREYHQLPLVILTRNKRKKQFCVVDPYALAKKLYGIGHVIVTNTRDESTMEILYPNTYSEKIPLQKESPMMAICESNIHKFLTYENSEYLKFDELMNLKLHHMHTLSKQDSSETKDLFMEEIQGLEEILNQLEEEYTLLNQELLELNEKEKELNKKLSLYNKDVLLYTSHSDYEKDRKQLVEFLTAYVHNFEAKTPYRKIPVLNSIIRGNQS